MSVSAVVKWQENEQEVEVDFQEKEQRRLAILLLNGQVIRSGPPLLLDKRARGRIIWHY